MHNEKKITEDIYYIGLSDRKINLFENNIPIHNGVSYNSYLIKDEKTVLLDTVDYAVGEGFFENLNAVLDGRKLDYVIVNHMEPDHCATLNSLVLRYPDIKIVCNTKSEKMIKQFFDFDIDSRKLLVKEGDTLDLGKHKIQFVMAPMVHWPEVMVSYDTYSKILFSADAFGTFGALSGNIFADKVQFEKEFESEARLYYTNIVGKYGPQVLSLLDKASKLDIKMICPLHGPVWRENLDWYIDKYKKWASYTPEEDGVVIAYGSIYGNTENAASVLANKLAEKGVNNIRMYDVSKTPASEILAQCFRFSHLVFASSTFNGGIFITMENLLLDIQAHNLQNRTIAFIENGTWNPTSGKQMHEILSKLKNTTFIDEKVTIKSSLKENQLEEIDSLACAISASMGNFACVKKENTNAFFNLSYGLFVLTSKDENKDNGCIINTVTQITDSPNRISIAVNKTNFTNEMIKKAGVFNVSVISEKADFDLFKRFGFSSGKDTDKFDGYANVERSKNGLLYLTSMVNAYLSAKVIDFHDYGTHTVFVAEVTESKVLNQIPSATYTYYFDKIKPKTPVKKEEKKGKAWVCKICGYVYYGDEVPDDYICPICKHGKEAFELMK